MKKQFFNKGLYLEGLHQLKLIGILLSVIFCLVAIIPPVGQGIVSLHNLAKIHTYNPGYTPTPNKIDGVLMNPVIFAVFLVIAPILVFILFGFLNKRKSSDFYHAIPHTRLSIFLSFYAAVITWVAIMIVSSSVCAIIGYAIFPQFFIPQYTDLLLFMLTCFVISILIVGAALIASSLSGTTATNILLTVLILYLPRITLTALNFILMYSLPIIPSGHSFLLFDNSCNLLFSFVASFFTGNLFGSSPYINSMTSVHGLIYTTVLAVIFTVLAAILFIRRKSESAERSAPSKRLQATYRIIVTMIICLFACMLIFSLICSKDSSMDTEIFGIVVLYIAALVVYFAYELITTRKWKNLLRAMPGLGIVAALNVAILCLLGGLRAYNLSFTPSADEIKSISIIGNSEYEDNYYHFGYEYSFYDYVQSKTETIKLDTPESKEIIAYNLSDCVEILKEYGANRYWYGISHSDFETPVTVKITTNRGSRYRTVYVTNEELNLIANQLANDPQYADLYMNLPKMHFELGLYRNLYVRDNAWNSYYAGNNNTARNILDTLQEEINAMGFDKWFALVSQASYRADRLAVIYTVDSGETVYIYINPDDMPQTYKQCLAMMANEDPSESIKVMKNSVESETTWIISKFTIILTNPDTDAIQPYYFWYSSDSYSSGNDTYNTTEQYENAVNFLSSKIHRGQYNPGDSFLKLSIDAEYKGDDTDYTHDSMYEYLCLSDITEKDLLSLGFTTENIYGDISVIYD
ncbi:MAG: hypothetical protein ACI3YK_02700 [Eubacteriales bacterium]